MKCALAVILFLLSACGDIHKQAMPSVYSPEALEIMKNLPKDESYSFSSYLAAKMRPGDRCLPEGEAKTVGDAIAMGQIAAIRAKESFDKAMAMSPDGAARTKAIKRAGGCPDEAF